MAAITGSEYVGITPGLGKASVCITTPATADSADTIDVSAYFSEIDFVMCYDKESGDQVTATGDTTITIDAAGGTTDHIYVLFVIGTRA